MAQKEETIIQNQIKQKHNFKDLIGKRYGKLIVIGKTDKRTLSRRIIWKCQCDCGNITYVSTNNLNSNTTKSCGCLRKSICGNKNPSYKHGLRNNKLYGIWSNMKERCYNPNYKKYKNYGGRGIKVCDEWLDKENGFENFYNWAIANGYNENAKYGECTIDRINVNGSYEPSNCRWITNKEQALNKTNTHYVEYKGETHTISEWSKILKIDRSLLNHRILNGWTIEKAFMTPIRRINNK